MTTNKDFRDFFMDLVEAKKKKMKEKELGNPINTKPMLDQSARPDSLSEQTPPPAPAPRNTTPKGSPSRPNASAAPAPARPAAPRPVDTGSGDGGSETNQPYQDTPLNPSERARAAAQAAAAQTPRGSTPNFTTRKEPQRPTDYSLRGTTVPIPTGSARDALNKDLDSRGAAAASAPAPAERRDPGTGEKLSTGKDLNRLSSNAERDPGTGELKSQARDLGAIQRMQSAPPPPPRPAAAPTPAPVARSAPPAPTPAARSNDPGTPGTSAPRNDDETHADYWRKEKEIQQRLRQQPESESGPRNKQMKESTLINAFMQLMNSKNSNLFEASRKMKKGESSPPPGTTGNVGETQEPPKQTPPKKTGTEPVDTQKNEEVEHIDEVLDTPKAKKSYLKKAGTSLKKARGKMLDPFARQSTFDKYNRIYHKRSDGIDKVKAKMKNEEVEQIDELKKSALQAVRNRASGRLMDDPRDEKAYKVEKQASARLKKITDAEKEESSKRAYARYKAEEVEQIDETSHKKLSKGQKHIAKQAGDPNKIEADDLKKLRSTKEEVTFSDAELEHIAAILEEPRSKEHDDAVAEFMKKGGKVTKLPAQKPEEPGKVAPKGSTAKAKKAEAKEAEKKLGIPSVQKKTLAGHPVAPHLVAKQEKARSKALGAAKSELEKYKAEKSEREKHDPLQSNFQDVVRAALIKTPPSKRG